MTDRPPSYAQYDPSHGDDENIGPLEPPRYSSMPAYQPEPNAPPPAATSPNAPVGPYAPYPQQNPPFQPQIPYQQPPYQPPAVQAWPVQAGHGPNQGQIWPSAKTKEFPEFWDDSILHPGDQKDEHGEPLPVTYTYEGQVVNPNALQNLLVPEGYRPVHIIVSSSGVETRDLPESDAEVAHFIRAHHSRPRATVHVRGTHTKTVRRNGKNHRKTVVDFDYHLDVSQFVLPAQVTDEALWPSVQRFVQSTNSLKRIVMTKDVVWDLEYLRNTITAHLRNQGYHHRVHVDLPTQNDTIIVTADNDCTRCCRSTWTDILMFSTCICVLFYPIKWGCQETISFRSPFYMSVNAQDWFQQNVHQITRHRM